MSNINVKRLVDNIRSGTNIYTPVIELVVNSIQAIEQTATKKGLVEIEIIRDDQIDALDRIADVAGFIVKDNGVGFNQVNRDAFDTLYTEHKASDGGKGFGRFTCLKYFERVTIQSTYLEEGKYFDRSFKMGLAKDIIVDETRTSSQGRQTGTVVELSGIRTVKIPDKKLETVSRVIVERLLPYFVDKDKNCPRIVVREANNPQSAISLNDYLGTENCQIAEITTPANSFALQAGQESRNFLVRVFKFYAPRTQLSKISLVAHRREVTETPLQNYIPEFAEEFFEPSLDGDPAKGRNFVIKAYVFSQYLNDNVSLERGEFRFQKDNDLLSGISQGEIERKAAEIARASVGAEIVERKRRKEAHIGEYVMQEAPWHRVLAAEVDFSALPMRPSNQDIEIHLQRKKFEKEIATRSQVAAILKSESTGELGEQISQLVKNISETSKNDLIHYVSMRKCVLALFSKSLEVGADGKYRSEGDVHDIIMRRKKDNDALDYDSHNLWMLDERLNFAAYVSSDKGIDKGTSDRTDITVFNRRVAFRGENEASNPITIFEFKRPQRDDFADPSSKEDPVQQIVRYVNQIREGHFKTPTGRDILVNTTTPFYGYVVCDLTKKVKRWLELEKEFTQMPDGLGWFRWFGNNNLYMEIISWTKLLRDAEMRNKIFFNKLGID